MTARWMILGLVLALGLAGCDDDGTGDTDAGPGGDTDAGPGEMGGPAIGIGDDPATLMPADYSCTPTAPAGGADVTFNVSATVFGGDGEAGVGLNVQFYPDNMVDVGGACAGSCITGATDASGLLEVTAPAGGWYGYRIEAGTGAVEGLDTEFITVIQYNEAAPDAAGDVDMNAIPASLRDQIVLLLGTSAVPGTATITGTAADCGGNAVVNANVRVFDSNGRVDIGFDADGPREFYFNGDSFPAGVQRRTNTDGLFGIANLPVVAGGYRVEIWGSTVADAAPELLGCEQIEVAADGVTIINVGPTRSDGPSGCGG